MCLTQFWKKWVDYSTKIKLEITIGTDKHTTHHRHIGIQNHTGGTSSSFVSFLTSHGAYNEIRDGSFTILGWLDIHKTFHDKFLKSF